jgi:hypothetical protein
MIDFTGDPIRDGLSAKKFGRISLVLRAGESAKGEICSSAVSGCVVPEYAANRR